MSQDLSCSLKFLLKFVVAGRFFSLLKTRTMKKITGYILSARYFEASLAMHQRVFPSKH
jgi:hypothetical protein